jgi:hypothetical protein
VSLSANSSLERALHGRQEPRLLTLPPRAGSKVDELLDLLYLVGLGVDPWQEASLDALLSVDDREQWTCTEFGELVARQNGKGNVILPYELGHLFLWPREDGEPKLIVHTAHEFKTAREAFRRIERVIRSSPLLAAELKGGVRGGISTSHGEEGFELKDGTRLRFLARSKNSGVGFTCDVLVVDEGQQTPVAAMDALLPTMSSVPNHQILFTGTVPDELDDSEYFEGVRDRGRSGSDRRSGWIEFFPDGSDDPDVAAALDIEDRELWEQANPALGIRMKPEAIEERLPLAAAVAITFDPKEWTDRFLEVAYCVAPIVPDRWEAQSTAMQLVGIDAGTATTVAIPRRDFIGLTFGDSITAGIRTVSGTRSDKGNTDATLGYGFHVQDNLGAEIGVVGFGGSGLSFTNMEGVPPFATSLLSLWGGGPAAASRTSTS